MPSQLLKIIGALPYEQVRDDCHRVKTWTPESETIIRFHANRIAQLLPDNPLLIPAPSHTGRPTHSFLLAQYIGAVLRRMGKINGFFNPLCCKPRQSFCELKHQGTDISGLDCGFYFMDPEKDFNSIDRERKAGFNIVIVDNVVDTGKTARAILKLTGDAYIAAIGDTGNWKQSL